MALKIKYDARMRSGDQFPYRTDALYRPDLNATYRLKPGASVDIIREHGDEYWTTATLVGHESVPHSDGQCQRFMVTINGEPHTVSEDRIRPAVQ